MQTSKLNVHDSRAALVAHLNGHDGPSILLGQDADAPREFYSASLCDTSHMCELGLICSGHGPLPQAFVFMGRGRAIVGHDSCVSVVELSGPEMIARRPIEGVFYEFLDVGAGGRILVVHELGVALFSDDGSALWSKGTDVIEDAMIDDGGALLLRFVDSVECIRLALDSGEIL